MKHHSILLNLVLFLVWESRAQEFDIDSQYSPLERTYAGKSCLDCMEEGRNHCLLSSVEGVCCDKGDPRCKQTALNYNDGRYCAEAVDYDKLTSYFTCPTTNRCPQGNVELDLTEYDRVQGFSDSWAWYQYIFGSVCKFRVYSSNAASNIILKVNSVVGAAPVRVFIMDKNAFTYPQQSYDVVVGSTQTNFNISSTYFEFLVYVLPDTFSSGSYRIDVSLEKAYQPEAFKEAKNATNTTDINGDDTSVIKPEINDNNTNSSIPDNNSTNKDPNETVVGTACPDSGDPECSAPAGPVPQPSSDEIAQEILERVETGAIKPESGETWDPSRLIKDKDSFMLLLVVAAIFCVLCCFMVCIGYWLTRHSWKQNKNI